MKYQFKCSILHSFSRKLLKQNYTIENVMLHRTLRPCSEPQKRNNSVQEILHFATNIVGMQTTPAEMWETLSRGRKLLMHPFTGVYLRLYGG